MVKQRFLAGCLALAAALSLPAAIGQSPTPIPRSPAPPPAAAPPVITPTPSLPSPVIAPPPAYAPAPVIARDVARGEARKTYDFESDTVDGELLRPDAAAVAPPEVPAYSDLCKASPKPPWCSDAPKGSGN